MKNQLLAIDDGRFRDIINALHIDDHCAKCYYFMPNITNPRQSYNCRCLGTCIAATLSRKMQQYLWWKLGLITENEYNKQIFKEPFWKSTENF